MPCTVWLSSGCRLAVQGKAAPCALLKVVWRRPRGRLLASRQVPIPAAHPDVRRFPLSGAKPRQKAGTEAPQAIATPGLPCAHPLLPARRLAQKGRGLQVGKTRWTHYRTAFPIIWYGLRTSGGKAARVLTNQGEKAPQELMTQCCERHGLIRLALETDQDHVPVFVSAPPRCSPAALANLLTGASTITTTRL